MRAFAEKNTVLFNEQYGKVRGTSKEERYKAVGAGVVYDVKSKIEITNSAWIVIDAQILCVAGMI